MLLVKPPAILKPIARDLIWDIPNENGQVFLTFDDGPTPGVTEQALELLKEYEAKATFFCLGKNVRQNPELFQRIIKEGHAIGNHTYSHVNGWSTDNKTYFREVAECQEFTGSNLFRPPYGKITRSQARILSRYFNVVMWSIISGDYDERISPERCTRNVTRNVKSGSIVVLHDSLKAKTNMIYSLQRVLEDLAEKGLSSVPIG